MQLSKLLLAITLTIPIFAQEPSKPRISNIAAVPSDPASASSKCAASWSGYLEHKGKKVTDAEISRFVTTSLRDGYVLTIYPETSNGVFVDMACSSKTQVNAPEHP
jgi:hypothetical protein